jgi:NAD(P)-dependent dehydrogenase (short-subunit alcohol dehydrogenase family)
MNPSYDFTGQVALVTGASSGMGLATARAFAESGAGVVLADINHPALTTVTGELTAAGHQVLGVPCDVADEDQVAPSSPPPSKRSAASTWPSTTPASSFRSATRPTNRRRRSTG